MIVLSPNDVQFEALNGFRCGTSKLEFTKDASGKWIVGKEVLNDVNFSSIKDELKDLDEITFTPFE